MKIFVLNVCGKGRFVSHTVKLNGSIALQFSIFVQKIERENDNKAMRRIRKFLFRKNSVFGLVKISSRVDNYMENLQSFPSINKR
jgi:hypothetical protein